MKQRFSISRDTGGATIGIKEYAELEKGVFSLLCEESYEVAAIEAALGKGPGHVVALLRTESFFPTSYFVGKLTANLVDYIKQAGSEPVEFDADDSECIRKSGKHIPAVDTSDIDVLLGVDIDVEDLIDDDEPVGKLDAPLKIAEDDTVEISNSL